MSIPKRAVSGLLVSCLIVVGLVGVAQSQANYPWYKDTGCFNYKTWNGYKGDRRAELYVGSGTGSTVSANTSVWNKPSNYPICQVAPNGGYAEATVSLWGIARPAGEPPYWELYRFDRRPPVVLNAYIYVSASNGVANEWLSIHGARVFITGSHFDNEKTLTAVDP